MHPLLILAIGVAAVVVLIVVCRVHAFIALIVSALIVSFLAPGMMETKVERVAAAFGNSAGKIGIVIALASVIGACMLESGAADRIVRAFLSLLGEKRSPMALMSSAYVLGIPVFYDTVFYLLVPLARSLYQRTGKNYLLYLMAIAAGGAITHTLVPPTPGPLIMAAQLNVDIGVMIVMGMLVAAPAALAGLVFSHYVNRRMPIPMREVPGVPTPEPLPEEKLPPLWLAIMPVVLPVLLITANTVVDTMAKGQPAESYLRTEVQPYAEVIGNANFALLISAAVAVFIYWRQLRPTAKQTEKMVETALLSGGVIILITAAGGAFGAMLKAAQIGPAIEKVFESSTGSGMIYLFLAFGIGSLLKTAQGSATVAMITGSSMLAAMIGDGSSLPFHPVYVALALGAGSKVASWMNDSGFWIFAKMGGLTEVETLRSWTPLLCVTGITALTVTVVLAILVPLK
jgi:GntP family gluconate:H+ symporter